ncbi:MAG TPA: hypothetical protein VIM11_25930 [Tepidisphaeraceae bacterium]|jgi:hypothetical protein
MRWIGLVLIVVIAVGAGPATQPAGKKKVPAGGERTIHGMVAGVEGRVLRISILKKKSELKERRVRTGNSTAITLNQISVALSALKAGENVTIKVTRGIATHIDATGK